MNIIKSQAEDFAFYARDKHGITSTMLDDYQKNANGLILDHLSSITINYRADLLKN